MKAPMPELEEQVPEKRALKGVLAAVHDQRFVVTLPARPGRMAEVNRYDRMSSPPCITVPHQPRNAGDA